MTTLDRFVSGYGHDWNEGILSEHVYLLEQAGGTVRRDGDRDVVDVDGRAVPVVCSELIEIHTEDGPITGRCGYPVVAGDAFCVGHRSWLDDEDAAARERA